MVASHYGHTEVVKELAKRGVDLNQTTVSIAIGKYTKDSKLHESW